MTTHEVFGKIKEMSRRTANPRPLIAVLMLAEELRQAKASIMPLLMELKAHRLIKFNEPAALSVKLTLLGSNLSR